MPESLTPDVPTVGQGVNPIEAVAPPLGWTPEQDIAITGFAVDDGGSGGYNSQKPVDNDSASEKDQKSQREATGSTYSYYKEREVSRWENKFNWGQSNTSNSRSTSTLISDAFDKMPPKYSVTGERNLDNVYACNGCVVAAGASAAVDGPLPVGDLVALGILAYAVSQNPQMFSDAWNSLTGRNSGPYTVLTDNGDDNSDDISDSDSLPLVNYVGAPMPNGDEDPEDKAMKEAAAEAICDAAGSPVCLSNLSPDDLMKYAHNRATELQNALPTRTSGSVTMGVGIARNKYGDLVTLIGSSETNSYLRKPVRELVRPDEIVVSGLGHAEEKIVKWATQNECELITVGAGRPICPSCAGYIEGVELVHHQQVL